MFIVCCLREFSRLHNLHPWQWTSLLQFQLLWGKFAVAHFAAAKVNRYNLAFSFHQTPITAGWTEAAWDEMFV